MRCVVAALPCLVALVLCPRFSSAETITGKVVDTSGKPIANANVFVSRPVPPENAFKGMATMKTDASGAFSVELTGEATKTSDGTPGPKWYGLVTVTAPGFGTNQAQLETSGNVVSLDREREIRGQVVDASGKGVPNTPVRLAWYLPRQRKTNPLVRQFIDARAVTGTDLEAQFIATTAADGTYVFRGFGDGGQGIVTLESEEFALRDQRFGPGGEPVPPLTAKPTPVVTGRVVDKAGNAIEGIQVSVLSREGGNQAKTGADGTFRLSRLPATVGMVTVLDRKNERVAPALTNVALTEGKTTVLPDFVMNEGGRLAISVVDDETGKPLRGWVNVGCPNWPSSPMTGPLPQELKDGVATVRVAPGQCEISAPTLPGYPDAGGTTPVTVAVKEGETVPVVFRMKRGLTAEGTAVDENGAPLKGVHLRILREWETYEFERAPGNPTDERGKWKLPAISRQADRLKIFVDDAYTVVSPEKLDPSVLAKGPLTVKLKRSESRPLTGRVVLPSGEPLPDLQINVSSYLRQSDGNITDNTNKTVTTDAEGRYSVRWVRPKAIVSLRPQLQGHRYLSGGATTERPDTVFASDIVMVPLTGHATGRVLNAAGKPVAFASVWAREGLPEAKATTDAAGKFALRNLPTDGPLRITAAIGRSKAVIGLTLRKGKPTAGTLDDLVLSLEPAPSDAETNLLNGLLDSLNREAANNPTWAGELKDVAKVLARRDPERALRWRTGPDETVPDADRFAIVEAVSRRNPARIPTWSLGQIARFKETNWKCCAESELAILLAPTDSVLANKVYDAAMAHLRESGSTDPFNYARLAAASNLLHRDDGDALIAKLKEVDTLEWDQLRTAGAIARGDTVRALTLVDSLPETYRPYGYAAIIREVVKTSPLTAQQILERMRPLVKKDDYSANLDFLRMARKVIRGIGPTDPEGALTLARSVIQGRTDYPQFLPMVLATAAAYQKGEKAKVVWKEASDLLDGSRSGDAPGRFAELAQFCEALGGPPDIASSLRKRAVTTIEQFGGGFNTDESFLFHVGFFNPALVRRLAEQMIDFQANVPSRERYGHAMASIGATLVIADPLYAAEIVDATPDETEETAPSGKGWARFAQRLFMAKILLLTPKERQGFLFSENRYGAEDFEW